MIHSLNLLLLGVLPVLLLLQQTRGAFILVASYVVLIWAFVLYEPHLSDSGYYLAAAASDAVVVYLAGAIQPIRLFNIRMQRAAILSILVNASGFVLWFCYQPAVVYNECILLAHCYLIWVVCNGDRDSSFGSDRDIVRFNYRSGFIAARKGH